MALDPITLREVIETGYVGAFKDDVFQNAVSLYAIGYRGEDLIQALIDLGFSKAEAEKATKKVMEMEKGREGLPPVEATQVILAQVYFRIYGSVIGKILKYLRKIAHPILEALFGARSIVLTVGLGNSPYEYGLKSTSIKPIRPGIEFIDVYKRTKIPFTDRNMASEFARELNMLAIEKIKGQWLLYDVESAIDSLIKILANYGISAPDIKQGFGVWELEKEPNLTASYSFDVEIVPPGMDKVDDLLLENARKAGLLPSDYDNYSDEEKKEFLEKNRKEIENKFLDEVIKNLFRKEFNDFWNFSKKHIDMLKAICKAFEQQSVFFKIFYRRWRIPSERTIIYNC